MLGVCADGFVVYEDEDEEKKHIFIWPRVLNMSFRHSNFHARISNLEVLKQVYHARKMLAQEGNSSGA